MLKSVKQKFYCSVEMFKYLSNDSYYSISLYISEYNFG